MLDCCASGYCAGYEAAELLESATVALLGEAWEEREGYGIRFISEDDIPDYDYSEELSMLDSADALYELQREATLDTDYA